MARHSRKTEIRRELVSQEARIVFTAELEEGEYCQVQVLTPSDPGVVAWVDQTPEQIGPNRAYKGAPMTASRYIPIDLLPGQFLVLATESQVAACTLIVHYFHES